MQLTNEDFDTDGALVSEEVQEKIMGFLMECSSYEATLESIRELDRDTLELFAVQMIKVAANMASA